MVDLVSVSYPLVFLIPRSMVVRATAKNSYELHFVLLITGKIQLSREAWPPTLELREIILS
jgi:hypothetical protein